MYSRNIERLKKKIKLNRRQREIIVGKILGDGCLDSINNGRTVRLKIEHSIKQKEYVEWIYWQLSNLVMTPPKIKTQKRAGKNNIKYWFNTLGIVPLRFYYQQFYPKGKKLVPKQIHLWLTPLALAVWFMDDGSIKSKECRGKYLNTQGYDDKSIERLQKSLRQNFGIATTIRQQSDGKQIYIPSSEIVRLREVIGKFVIPSMKYKLG